MDSRKKTKRACDVCNLKRSRCDGMNPCGHCVRTHKQCTYNRAQKRRGRASEKYPKNPKRRKDSKQAPKEPLESVTSKDMSSTLETTVSPPASLTKNLNDSSPEFFPNIAHPESNTSSSGNHWGQFPTASDTQSNSSISETFLATDWLNSEYSLNLSNYIFSIDTRAFQSKTYLQTSYKYSMIDDINGEQGTGSRYSVLDQVASELQTVNLPGNVASDLLDFYFSSYVYPSCKVTTMIHKRTILSDNSSISHYGPALVLSLLTVATFDANHFFLTGHKRKLIFGHLHKLTPALLKIDPQNEDFLVSGSLQDVMTCINLACLAPFMGNPRVSFLWLKRAVNLAKDLKLNQEVPYSDTSVPESVREERRRTWWTLYILDRHLSIALNTPLLISDCECSDLFHPCDDQIFENIKIENLPSPFLNDLSRVKGLSYRVNGYGAFGWMLPASMVISKIMQVAKGQQSSPNLTLSDLKEFVANYAKSIPSLLQYSHVDKNYASVIATVLETITSSESLKWDPMALLNANEPFEEIMERCTRYGNEFQQLQITDPDTRRYPFLIRVYVFFVTVDTIRMLGAIDKKFPEYKQKHMGKQLTKLCHQIKKTVYVIIRALESLMSTLPVDYLRVMRNSLMDALRDMDCLLLVSGFDKTFELNKQKRKKILEVYSHVVNGMGVGL